MKQVVYVASPKSEQIHVWQLAASGELTLLQIVAVGSQVQPMAISPDRCYLYTGVRPKFGIITWRIMSNGQLEKVVKAPLLASPTHISTDLQGRFLFCASYNGNCVSVSSIDDGIVLHSPVQQIDALLAPHSANIDPLNQLLWVPCLKADQVRLFDFSMDGKLSPHNPEALNTTVGAGPRHMVFHPDYNVAYCINELNSSVDVYSTFVSEGYHLIQTLDVMPAEFTGTCWAADIHLTPNGRYLYVSDRTANILSIFKVKKEGQLIGPIGYHLTEIQPRGFNIDHSGGFLIASGQKSDHITVYQITQDSGQLAVLDRYPVGKGPMWVSILQLNESPAVSS